MKKLVCVTGIILISCVCISALASPQAVAQTEAAPTVPQTQSEQGFVIKDCEGRLAVFRKGESTPFITTETYTNTLPRADINKLKQGIEAENAEKMRKLLEDYCS